MDQVEASGKTVDDALKNALSRMGATMDDVQFVVLDEGRKGFLGRGARDAIVRVERIGASEAEDGPAIDRSTVDTSIPRRGQGRSRGGGGGRGENRGDGPPADRPAGDRPPSGDRGDQGDRGGRGRGGRGRSSRELDAAAPRLTEGAFTRPGETDGPQAPPPRRFGGDRDRDRDRGPRPERSSAPRGERRPRRQEDEPYVEPNIDAPEVDFACQAIDDMLRLLEIEGDITIRAPETPGDGLGMALAVVDISGEDLGLLIGRRGDTLSSFQYVVNLIVQRKYPETHSAVTIDVEQYRKRRELQLIDLATRMADRVRRTGSPITLEPMTPAERRIIHVTLAEDADLETNSIGEGEDRKVVISARR